MQFMTFDDYQETICEGGSPDAGYWNRVIDYLHSECDPEVAGDGAKHYRVADLEAAEAFALEYMAS